jgi:hypothetical protein
MNRRVLAIARFNADPEAVISAHAARIASREGITLGGCPLRPASQPTSPAPRAREESASAPGSCVSSSNAKHWGRWRALARDGGDSCSCRGPPPHLSQNQLHPNLHALRARSHPHTRR